MATFQVLLHRYTGQEEILVGSLTSGRQRGEFERIVGYFANPVVMRADLSGNPTFRSFLSQVRDTVLNAFEHQDYPFPLLVEQLQPIRDASRSPLFQVMFVFEKPYQLEKEGASSFVLGESEGRMELGELVLEPLPFSAQQEGQFDLTLVMVEVDGTLSASLDYNTDLFDASTIARMAGHFKTLLEGILENPEQRISELPLLTEQERYKLLVEWNDTESDYPEDTCVHQLFETQVERAPSAIAAVFQNEQLTYQQLNVRVNQLAHYLMKIGVGPEVRVGVCMERSLEMVVGILGILKAGGAFVPLDPAYPKERLDFMLKDSRVFVLLTQNRIMDSVPECQGRVVCLDTDWDTISRQRGDNPASGVIADNLAYVIYTSGSTGIPKGVLVAHRGLCNLSKEQILSFNVGPGHRVLQFSSLSFDASIFETIMALPAGATLCLGTRESLLPGPDLIRFLREQAITIITFPPSALAALPVEDLPALRTITVAGEACSAELVQHWAVGRQFFNLYGPTESTIWATAIECIDGSRTPSIGRPIANTQIYILDSHLQPVPLGVPGELCISGVSLARGYLDRPELTAERFVPNPFADEPGARMYKTGDLARYLSDGNIEFLGRIDHQVKIRGFRIELGEIEAVLGQHTAVRETVVIAREDVPAEKRLVAYVVTDQKNASIQSDLRTYLKEKLPDFMVPSAYVILDSLPMTPNGKVDRRALPAPDRLCQSEEPYIAPGTDVELTIAKIWQEVLRLKKVGIHGNFFDLGGNSLLMARVNARLKEVTDRDISMIEMFKFPTISSLAGYLSQEKSEPLYHQESDDRFENMKVGKNRLKRQLQQRQRVAKREWNK
jgi:amino acid adenylation domain-containing protein